MSDQTAERPGQQLAARGVLRVRADNPSPLTLSGTNSWVVGEQPAWIIDPGPALDAHIDAIVEAVARRGGAGGIALTHDHLDHSESALLLRERLGVPLAAARGEVDVRLADGVSFGPLRALATPGHAPDHLALITGSVCFTGDAVVGEGSAFVAAEAGALAAYLHGLRRLRQEQLSVLCPGHGPAIWDPQAKLDEYIDHRLRRERLLLAALEQGRRSIADLLDSAWSDVPTMLRPAATVTLTAHLHKLDEEGLLPAGVEWPSW